MGVIRKNYSKKRFTEEELDKIIGKGKRSDEYMKIYEYKTAIDEIYCDRNGYLWALIGGSEHGDMVYDIFDNDKLIGNFILENSTGEKQNKAIYLKDRMYVVDHDNELIEVYDYEYK